MFNIVNKKNNLAFGLDISDLSLKLAQLKKTGNKIQITAIIKNKIPKGLIENGEIKNFSRLKEEIKKIIHLAKKQTFISNRVVACLPETKTFIKLIEIESGQTPDQNIIEKEMQKYFPFALKEIYYDWQLIEKNNNKYKILIGTAEKKIVEDYISLLSDCELIIEALEIEPISLCRTFLNEENPNFKERRDKNYLLIDLGEKRSSLTVYSQNTILFSFSFNFSGQEQTRKIAKILNISEAEAEKLKIFVNSSEKKLNKKIEKITEEAVKELIKKIKETLSFYENNPVSNGLIDCIILSGGVSNIYDLNIKINKSTDVKTIFGDIFTNLDKNNENLNKIPSEKYIINLEKNKKPIFTSQNNQLLFNTAIGLALRGALIEG